MSLEAIVWALKVVKLDDPIAKLVLIGLADHATDSGAAAWPSVATLAEYANVSTRTVIRKIQTLEELELIRLGDQDLVSHYRADRRPRVWDLGMSQRGDTVSRGDSLSGRKVARGDTGSGRAGPRGDTPDANGVTLLSDKPSFKPSLTTELSLRSSSSRARATRLDPEWMPSQELIAQMHAERPDVDLKAEHLKFVDFWCSKAGKDATKLDWVRTWRNWIRNARSSPINGNGHRPRNQVETETYLQRAMADAIELDEAQARKEIRS